MFHDCKLFKCYLSKFTYILCNKEFTHWTLTFVTFPQFEFMWFCLKAIGRNTSSDKSYKCKLNDILMFKIRSHSGTLDT